MSYDFDKYEGTDLPWPVHPLKPRLPTADAFAADFRKYADELDVYNFAVTAYHEKREEVLKEVVRRQREFETAIRYDYALSKEQFFILWNQAKYYAKSDKLKDITAELDRLHNFMARYIGAA